MKLVTNGDAEYLRIPIAHYYWALFIFFIFQFVLYQVILLLRNEFLGMWD